MVAETSPAFSKVHQVTLSGVDIAEAPQVRSSNVNYPSLGGAKAVRARFESSDLMKGVDALTTEGGIGRRVGGLTYS